jgi:hypothetical protein
LHLPIVETLGILKEISNNNTRLGGELNIWGFKRERERERERGFLKLIFFKLGRLDEGHQTDHVQRRFHAARTHMERHT